MLRKESLSFSIISGLCVAAILGAYLFLSNDSSRSARIAELEREVDSLRNQLAERDRQGAVIPPPSTVELANAPAPPQMTSDLTSRIDNLFTALASVTQASQELDRRITRSKLAVPTKSELTKMLGNLQPELEKQLEMLSATMAEARQIAAASNVKLDEKLSSISRSPHRWMAILVSFSCATKPSNSA